MKKMILLLTAILLSVGFKTSAQTTNDPSVSPIKQQLHDVVVKVQTKLKAGQKTEADLSDNIKQLDQILAEEKGAKTDEAAQIVYMKAMLYAQVIENTDKSKAILEQLKTDYPDTRYAKNADKIIASLDAAANAKKIQDQLAVGSVFPDFSGKDLNGNPISVANLKGKVVMVDFWATWCPPCRAELPNVIATYKKHHADGFEIIGVSLDSDRSTLDDFLKKTDGMTWPQYFDGLGWQNKLAVKYGVEAIPYDVLIGPDGKIIGTALRGDDLEAAVAQAVAKK